MNPRGKDIKCKPVLIVEMDGEVYHFPYEDRMPLREAQQLMRSITADCHPIIEQHGSDEFVEGPPAVEQMDG